MASPYQIPISTQEKRKYTMLDDYGNAIQLEDFTDVSAVPPSEIAPPLAPRQEREDFSSVRSQFSSFSPTMRRQNHVSLFSLLGISSPASAPMFHSSGTSFSRFDPMPLSSVPSATMLPPSVSDHISVSMLPSSGTRVPDSDPTFPSSGISDYVSASILPSYRTRVPDSEPTFPSSGISDYVRASMLPSSGTRVPDSDPMFPSSGLSEYVDASMLASSGTIVPNNNPTFVSSEMSHYSDYCNASMLPSSARIPCMEPMFPLSGISVPCSSSIFSSSGISVPCSNPMFQSSGTRVPCIDPMSPSPGLSVPFNATMLPSSETRVPYNAPTIASSGLSVPFNASMFPLSEISVSSASMLHLSESRVPCSNPKFPSPGISVPCSSPMFSSSEIRVSSSVPPSALMSPSSGVRVPRGNPGLPSSRIKHPPHLSTQQPNLLSASPEVPYPASKMMSVLPQHASPKVPYPARRLASLLSQHGRVHNIPESSFAPVGMNTKKPRKKARILETGSSSNQGASVFESGGGGNPQESFSPIAEHLKSVAEFSQLLNEICIPSNTADSLSEEKFLVNSYTLIDQIRQTWNTINDNSEIDEMNNWWDKVDVYDTKK